MPQDEKKSRFRLRLWRLSVLERLVAAVALLLIARLAVVQVAHGDQFSREAERNRVDVFATPAARGVIYDAHLHPLVYDVPSYSLSYIRNGRAVPSIPDIRLLARCLRVPAAVLERKFAAAAGSIQVGLASHVSLTVVSMVREHQEDLPGVQVIPDPLRVYPRGDVASHVIGYINSIPVGKESEYVRRLAFPPDTKIGWSGVERFYDSELRGSPGRIAVEVNSSGIPVRLSPDSLAASSGHALVLTLDAAYQEYVQRLLERRIRLLRARGHKVTHGMAVAIDPRSGAVLAMVSVPGYRPEWFVKGLSYALYQRQFAPAERNWATQAPVAPGSVLKPATALFALANGAIDGRTALQCDGGLRLPASDGTVIRCWAQHGRVNVEDALAESCDVFFYRASLRYGRWPPPAGVSVANWLNHNRLSVLRSLERMQRALGLGAETGIDLPGTEVGFVNENSGQLTDLPYTAIGQNEVFTPLELCVYAASLANGGHLIRPHVVDRILSGRRVAINAWRHHAESGTGRVTLRQLGVTADDIRVVREGMYLACNRRDGTAYGTFHSSAPPTYRVAGKTGTAETGVNGFDNAVFIGFAPFEHPRIAIAVVIPGGGHGADSTVPVARAMFDRFFAAPRQENSRVAWNIQRSGDAERGGAGGQ